MASRSVDVAMVLVPVEDLRLLLRRAGPVLISPEMDRSDPIIGAIDRLGDLAVVAASGNPQGTCANCDESIFQWGGRWQHHHNGVPNCEHLATPAGEVLGRCEDGKCDRASCSTCLARKATASTARREAAKRGAATRSAQKWAREKYDRG